MLFLPHLSSSPPLFRFAPLVPVAPFTFKLAYALYTLLAQENLEEKVFPGI
jgi:hypothetical protein